MKLNFFSLLLLIFLMSSCNSIKTYNASIEKKHSVKELQNNVDLVYSQLQRLHPRLYEYTTQEVLNYKFDSIKNSITTPLTSYQFYNKLTPGINAIRQGHTSIRMPRKRYTKKENKKLKKHELSDFKLDYRSKHLFIKSTKTDSSLVGAKLIKIEEDSVSNLIKNYKKRFASDGYNTSFYNRYLPLSFFRFYTAGRERLQDITLTLSYKDSIFTKVFKRKNGTSTK